MDKTTHEDRLAYWKSIARKCQARPEGQTAASWIEENGIHTWNPVQSERKQPNVTSCPAGCQGYFASPMAASP